jgi:uncharacterized protein YjbJ (UPF0337 family)
MRPTRQLGVRTGWPGYLVARNGRESNMARSRQRDKSGGTVEKVVGRLKEAGGALTGNESRKARGQGRQAKGSVRQKKGHLRDLFR